jgi:two-component system, NtrC family, sensor kinase
MKYETDNDKYYYRSLRRNMALTIIIVSAIPLILISAITRHYFQVSYRDKVLNNSKLSIAKHRQLIESFLTERIGALRVQAKSFTFDQLSDGAFLRDRLAILQEEYGPSFMDLGVVNDNGAQVAYAGPYKLQNADYSEAEWFQKALGKDYYVSDVFYGLRGFPHLALAVRQEQSGQKWILRATINFESFKTLVENIGSGPAGIAFILNKEGKLQAGIQRAAILPKDDYLNFLASKPGSDDEVGIVQRSDGEESDSLDLMTRLNDGSWVLVHHQSAEEAYAELYAARRSAILVFFIGILGLAVGSIFLSQRMVRHIAQEAQEKQTINQQLIEAGKLASLGELAAGVAHEVNNPLGIMLQEAGWMQDLLEEEDLKSLPNLDEFNKSLSRMQTQGRRCKEITHKLLSFARKTDPTVKTTQLNELIKEVVDLCQQRAHYSNVQVNTNLQDSLPLVNVSPSEVQQVLLNLMNNSLDAMGDKGGTISVTSRVDDNSVIVDVADDGPGIPEANLLRVFEPFFTTKPVGQGTGLGLSICYGIVKKMGGEILVESELGIGTTFHVYFPQTRRKSATT